MLKKNYLSPEFELIKLSTLDDFLAGSPDDDTQNKNPDDEYKDNTKPEIGDGDEPGIF